MINKNILLIIYCFLSLSMNLYGQNKSLYAEDYQMVTHDGAWCWFSDPRAVYIDGKIFGGFVDKEGSIWAFRYDPVSQEKNQYKLFDKLNYDDHANPSIMVLPDNRLVLFYSAHSKRDKPHIYYSISKLPADISSWEEVRKITPVMTGNMSVCYSNPIMLSDENNRVYVFFRGRDFKPTYVFSDDNMKSWSEPFNLVKNDPAYGNTGRPYTKIASNNRNTIFFAFTDAHPRGRATNSIYFMMYKDGKLMRADGTIISDTLSSVMPSQVDKVYDATKTFDKAWIWDVAFDENEYPVLVYARFAHANSEHSYWYARWNGSKWNNYKITTAGQCFMRNDYNNKNYIEYENNYSGGVYLDHNNPSIVYTSRPINNVFEIEKWTFIDEKNGKWKNESVTYQSERDNIRPYVIRNYTDNYPSLLWMYNYKYPNFVSYDCAIRINQEAKGFNPEWNRDNIIEIADTVFAWTINKYKQDQDYCSQNWLSGVLYNGMYDWAETKNSKSYFDFMNKIFSKYSWQLGNRMYHGDDLCVGQVYLDMYERFNRENMMIPTKARLDWIIDNQPADNIDNTKGKSDRWWWCDALYMTPAVFTRMYALTGDKKYIKFAHKEFLACYNQLYDKNYNLFFRDSRFIRTKNVDGKPVFWSRGNGWVLAGLAEIIKTLPEGDKKYRPFYVQLFCEMCKRIISLQDADGYWKSDLLSPDIYPMPETSGTGLFVYAIMYGINAGILDEETYLPVVKKGWEAIVKAVDTEGKVGWTQMVADRPGGTEKKNNRQYSTGSVLMIASELCKYLDK